MNKHYVPKRTREYDEEKVLHAISNLKIARKEERTIFFDMDNTLFIYSTDSNDRKSLVEENNPGFFANLELMEYARETILSLRELGYDCKIISAADEGPKRSEKIISIKKNELPFADEDILFVPHGKSKAELLASMGFDIKKCILVDDYCGNIFDWYDHGGLAVKKTFSNKKRNIPQVHNLYELVDLVKNLDK